MLQAILDIVEQQRFCILSDLPGDRGAIVAAAEELRDGGLVCAWGLVLDCGLVTALFSPGVDAETLEIIRDKHGLWTRLEKRHRCERLGVSYEDVFPATCHRCGERFALPETPPERFTCWKCKNASNLGAV